MFYILALVLIIFFLASAIKVLREYERGVIFRLGRLIKTKGPGLIMLIPVIEKTASGEASTKGKVIRPYLSFPGYLPNILCRSISSFGSPFLLRLSKNPKLVIFMFVSI